MTVFKKIIVFLILLVCLAVLALASYTLHLKNIYHTQSLTFEQASGPYYFEVKKGHHARKIVQELQTQGLLAESKQYGYALRLFGSLNTLHAGVYQLEDGLNMNDFWRRLEAGEQHYFSITLVEGRTFQEWQETVVAHPWIQSTLPVAEVETALLEQLGIAQERTRIEGLLFPDTYKFHAYTTDIELYKIAYQRLQQLLDELWQDRSDDLAIETPYQALILASIIEKETGAESERPLIAAVFTNRLKKKMRLQSDPTIIYGLGSRYRGVIYKSDILEKTPYNTYRISGLPPTPIAMIGRAAIEATLHPEQSDYFYFVSKNDGTHYFSKTLAEHNRAVQEYQRKK